LSSSSGGVKSSYLLSALPYAIGLYFFYVRYVPIVKPFQAVLIPVLLLVFILTVFRLRWGLLFFVFSFPLINNLPYFFGIHEPLPHAPSALVLFLFFFLGWLVHQVFSRDRLNFDHPIFRPLALFSLVLISSGIITFWKYTNFFPFLSDYVYELVVNVMGGSAGGAIMSTVFFSLNYLTGIAFLFILFNTVKSSEFIKKIVILLCISTFVSLMFGLYQRFGNMKFGNNPISIGQGLINSTFKDALSFGVYLAVVTPVILGAIFYFKKAVRFFPVLAAMLALYMIFFTGSKSGLICLLVSLFIFFALLIKQSFKSLKNDSASPKKVMVSSLIVVLVVSATLSIWVLLKEDIKTSSTILRLGGTLKRENVRMMLVNRVDSLWKVAGYMIKDYPMTGVGVGGYIIESASYAQEHKVNVGIPQSAENYLLQVGAELGLIGLLLVLWIFWEIVKQMKKSYHKIPICDNRKVLLIGAIAGVISYFINIQAHTYIGSYEIKYTFWLLVGLIFGLGKTAETGKRAKDSKDKDAVRPEARWGRNFKILSLAIISLYGTVHLWNSTHSLSLKSRTERLGIKQDFGFYEQEKTKGGRDFRWTRSYGGLTIRIEKPIIAIPLLATHPNIHENPVKVKVFLVKEFFKRKKLLGEIALSRPIWQTHEFFIPEEVGQEVILIFKVSRTWNPLKWQGTPDPRNLGIAVGSLEFKEERRE